MARQATLSEGRTLFVENNGEQTQITLQSGSAGQQQSQGTGFTTGAWQSTPLLHKTPQGAVLQVEGSRGRFYFQIAASSVRVLSEAPPLQTSESIPLQEAETSHMKPMSPMQPMKPMKPMAPMKPMELKLGDMHMNMGKTHAETASERKTEAASRFCTQCGSPAEADDKFCGKCGQKLRA